MRGFFYVQLCPTVLTISTHKVVGIHFLIYLTIRFRHFRAKKLSIFYTVYVDVSSVMESKLARVYIHKYINQHGYYFETINKNLENYYER